MKGPNNGMRRRRFLKAVPAAVAGGLAMPALAQPPAQEQARRISKDMLECGEKIFGVDFSDADEEQALAGVNRNLDTFEQLRAIDVPLDTEPAVTFGRTSLAGSRSPGPRRAPGSRSLFKPQPRRDPRSTTWPSCQSQPSRRSSSAATSPRPT